MPLSRTFLSIIIGASVFAIACGANADEPPSSPSPNIATATSTPVTPTPNPSPTVEPTVSATAEEPAPLPVTFSHDPGQHNGPLNVNLFSEDADSIRYTLDGSDPTSNAAFTYEDNIHLLASATIRAVAVSESGIASEESSATYDLVLAKLDQPRLDSIGGVFGEPQTVRIESGEPDATVYYTLDGSTPSLSNGVAYTEPLTIAETAQLRAVNVRPGMIDSDVRGADFRIFGRLVERTGDIDLTGDQQMVIEDTLFLHEGNINLNGDAQLIVRNSFVRHVKDFTFQYGVTARGNSKVILENSAVGSSCTGSFNYSLLENASLQADSVDIGVGSCNVWVFMGGTVDVDVNGWDLFGGTVCDGSAVQIEDSLDLEVEMCFPGGSVIDTSLPTEVATYQFGPEPANGVEFSLNMSNVTMDGWGINVLPGADITIRDADAITIGVIVGSPWNAERVELDDLQITRYADKTWQIGPDASLKLVNTNVYGWEPNVFSNNTLAITNSDYTASAVNGGDGHYEISDSIVDLLSANERVTMTVTNTVITGDVVANDDTVIILIDSEVRGTVNGDNGLSGGNVFARGNGKVILRNTSVAGNTIEQESGEIVVE